MPKTSKKNKHHIASLNINSNFNENNSKSNRETHFIDNDSNKVLTDIKPTFPPILTTYDLIKNANNGKAKILPNAFIAYRMALNREYRIKNAKIPPAGQFSKIAKESWNNESQNVKDYYNKLVEEAKKLFKQNTIQIVFDKHMNDVGNNQESGQIPSLQTTNLICDSDSDNANYAQKEAPVENLICTQDSSSVYLPTLPTEDPSISDVNSLFDGFSQVSYARNNFFVDPYGIHSVPNEQEHIRILQQIIIYLLQTNQ
ncbi:7068_t:CDS:1 [Funneliformis caledonium]|uniref:7068_t:CDS:1 n=1 Tax=Funneliformis caledonium TaxID=1117310 RepID=A0A9N9DM19_9GLOM|nr:7068_t:CDS:1 [Funneliformis caledonium]